MDKEKPKYNFFYYRRQFKAIQNLSGRLTPWTTLLYHHLLEIANDSYDGSDDIPREIYLTNAQIRGVYQGLTDKTIREAREKLVSLHLIEATPGQWVSKPTKYTLLTDSLERRKVAQSNTSNNSIGDISNNSIGDISNNSIGDINDNTLR